MSSSRGCSLFCCDCFGPWRLTRDELDGPVDREDVERCLRKLDKFMDDRHKAYGAPTLSGGAAGNGEQRRPLIATIHVSEASGGALPAGGEIYHPPPPPPLQQQQSQQPPSYQPPSSSTTARRRSRTASPPPPYSDTVMNGGEEAIRRPATQHTNV